MVQVPWNCYIPPLLDTKNTTPKKCEHNNNNLMRTQRSLNALNLLNWKLCFCPRLCLQWEHWRNGCSLGWICIWVSACFFQSAQCLATSQTEFAVYLTCRMAVVIWQWGPPMVAWEWCYNKLLCLHVHSIADRGLYSGACFI